MKYIATFDVGTTAVKGVLISEQGHVAFTKSMDVETIFRENFKEQNPSEWYRAFCEISKVYFENGYRPEDIIGIVMSGQMQDLISIDKEGNAVGNAILYTDARAQKQADEIAAIIGIQEIVKSTGNNFDGSMPFPKLLWLKQNRLNDYVNTHKILISSKDYIISKLTGKYVTDVVAGSTTGLMDIREKRWNTGWVTAVGMDPDKLPLLLYAEDKAGIVTEKAAEESGYAAGTPVYAGTGDAGATTLASGIASDGEFNINLGTSGWIASMSSGVFSREGVFNLAAMPRDLYINVVPFFNAGNVHKWISKTLAKDTEQNEKYDYVDELLEQSTPGSHGVMFLPYLTGERFPVVDTKIKGGFVGITPETTKQDLARSCLEGVSFSIRQGLESFNQEIHKISLIGGGAQDKVWCQIFADALDHEIIVYQSSGFLPSMAIASAVLVAQGRIRDYAEFAQSLKQLQDCVCYRPDPAAVERLNQMYERYRRIYPALKSIG